MNNKLEVKDLISVGIFTAIYLILFMMVVSIFGALSPFVYLFSGAISSVLLGTIYMLFISRTGKRFAVLLMGTIITSVIGLMFGGLWTVFVIGIICSILAEIIVRKGDFKSFRLNTISFVVFSFWSMGAFGAFWIVKDRMIEMASSGQYGEAYVEGLKAAASPLMLVLVIVANIVLAIVGAYIGKALLKKHFKRAGIA